MAETVYRHRRRPGGWMMDRRRSVLPVPGRAETEAALTACLRGAPGFFLALADLLDMPSGLHAAYIAGLAALGRQVRWPLAGAATALLLRMLSGCEARLEQLLTLLLLLPAPRLLRGRQNLALLLGTGICLLPMVIRGWMAPTALPAILMTGSMALSMLSAPVLCRGVKALTSQTPQGQPRPLETLEDRLGVAALVLMMMCGGVQLRVTGVNAGMAMACGAVLLLAMRTGAETGCMAGVIVGVGLSLAGLPVMLTIALAAGGFLAGVMQATQRRWLSCVSFASVALLSMVLSGVGGAGCAAAAVVSTAIIAAMPEGVQIGLNRQIDRLWSADAPACDAYAASMLTAWERTMEAMARSVPMPGLRDNRRDGAWWSQRLCAGCPEACGCMEEEEANARAEDIWTYRSAEDDVWQGALEGLRGLGCQRLFQLQQGMDAMRREDAALRRQIAQAREQRSMLVTHLTAIAGAARRFAHLSLGESWWDTLHARRIRAALSDAAAPVRLLWLRRLQGHVHAAFRLEDITNACRQAGELCELVGEAAGTPMIVVSIDQGCVRLAQRPPLEGACGICTISSDGQEVCGDTAWQGLLQDGRYMAAVSDGMGHGEDAALSSRQTVELLRLCLDAGYTLAQTLTAVNGMMLLSCGERFIAVDMLLVDLWTGAATLLKLGSAGSWLQRGEELTLLTGDALPLGILEGVEPVERTMTLQAGDSLVMMSDGVEEAFESREALETAVLLALTEEPEDGAISLMQAAMQAGGGKRRDDQTVMVLRLRAVQNVGKGV